MLGILSGRLRPDTGRVQINGDAARFDTPRDARAAGICSIYQELTIVPALSARANVFLGQEISEYGFVKEDEMDAVFATLADRLGVKIPSGIAARRLSIADQQALEIMRGLQSHAQILLFDEPTTALAPSERHSLFKVMRGLRDEGVTILLVSHNLDEVLDVSDHVTVFRDGRCVSSLPRAEWTKRSLITDMIGRTLAESEVMHCARPVNTNDVVLGVRNVSVPGAVSGAEMNVREGEIVGIGGLVGSGRTSILRAMAGLESSATGEMTVDGLAVSWPKSPHIAIGYGIGLVPEDRKTQGLIGSLSAVDNLSMAYLSRASRFGFIRDRERIGIATTVARAFGFDATRLNDHVKTLSGGNQQKVLLARWGYKVPRVLLIDEPTRGIDVGAKEEILGTIRSLAADGMAIIVVSSEIEELVMICDRVLVLAGGRFVAELPADREFDEADVMAPAFERSH